MADFDSSTMRRSLTIIYLAMIMSQVMFGVFGYVLSQQPLHAAPPAHLTWMIAPMAPVIALVTVLLRRFLLAAAAAAPTPGERLMKYQMTCVVTWALCESFAMIGLTSTLLTHDWRELAAGILVGLGCLAIYRPSSDKIDELASDSAAPV